MTAQNKENSKTDREKREREEKKRLKKERDVKILLELERQENERKEIEKKELESRKQKEHERLENKTQKKLAPGAEETNIKSQKTRRRVIITLSTLFMAIVVVVTIAVFLESSKSGKGSTDNSPVWPNMTESGKATNGIIKLTIATDGAYPPFESIDPATDEVVGFDIDLMMAISKAAGFEVEFVIIDWDSIFIGLHADKYDAIISGVTITDERKMKYDFTEPYYTISQALVLKTEDAEGIRVLDDLATKKIGAQHGTFGAMFIVKNDKVELVPYDDIELAFRALIRGDIVAVACDHFIAFYYVLKNDAYKGKLTVVNSELSSDYLEDYGIVVKKGNIGVLALINKGLAKVKKGNKIPELEKKWGMK